MLGFQQIISRRAKIKDEFNAKEIFHKILRRRFVQKGSLSDADFEATILGMINCSIKGSQKPKNLIELQKLKKNLSWFQHSGFDMEKRLYIHLRKSLASLNQPQNTRSFDSATPIIYVGDYFNKIPVARRVQSEKGSSVPDAILVEPRNRRKLNMS